MTPQQMAERLREVLSDEEMADLIELLDARQSYSLCDSLQFVMAQMPYDENSAKILIGE